MRKNGTFMQQQVTIKNKMERRAGRLAKETLT